MKTSLRIGILVTLIAMFARVSVTASEFEWRIVANMKTDRHWHASHVLNDGRLLIIGGVTGATQFVDGAGTNGRATASCEIYDPESREIFSVMNMHSPRSQFASVLLTSGQVVVMGGMSGNSPRGECTADVEMFDPLTDTWTVIGQMSSPRRLHSAIAIDDHRILVVGGALANQSTVTTTEIFDLATGKSRVTSPMPQLLKEGCLVYMKGLGPVYVGGRSGGPNSSRQRALLSFNLENERWHEVPMNIDLPLLTSAVSLNDRTIISCGGNVSEAPAYWSTGIFRITDGYVERFLELEEGRSLHALHPIGDGTVMVSGGIRPDLTTIASTLLIDAEYNMLLQHPQHVVPRALHTIARMQDPEYGLTFYAIGGLTDGAKLTNTIEMLVVRSEGFLRNTSSVDNDLDVESLVYPTVASDVVYVRTMENDYVQIVNSIGEIVQDYTAVNSTTPVNTTLFSLGTYHVKILRNGSFTTAGFVVVR